MLHIEFTSRLAGRKRFAVRLACLIAMGCTEAPTAAPLPVTLELGGPSDPIPGKTSVLTATRAVELPPHLTPRFVDVARKSGIDFSFFTDAVPNRYFLPEIMGGGAAWLDYDGDGRLDLYVRDGCRLEAPETTPPGRVSRLFRNMGHGEFRDVTNESTSAYRGYGQGCAVGDFDVDGFHDLYLTNFGHQALMHNNGDGTFTDVTDAAGVAGEGWGSSAAWFDADSDGSLDLYVATYMVVTLANNKKCEYGGKPGYCGPGSYQSVADLLYLNQGDETFIEAAEELGFHDDNGKGLAVVIADFDDDLLPEVYVANDMTPNHLFTRSTTFDFEGRSRRLYANVAASAGCAVSDMGMNEAGMGIACADFDGDGRIDIFLTHYYHAKNTLYHNQGRLIFDDDSRRTRIAATSFESLGFGTWAFDYDRDGDPDLFVANGHVLGPQYEPNAMRPQLLLNTLGVFSDISNAAGDYFLGQSLGRGVAAADYDDDGDIDLVVTHLDRPLALLRNDTTTGRRFIGLKLETRSRIPPVGGRVIVTCGSLRQVLPVISGGSYLSASDTRLLAGLGSGDDSVNVEIYWPSGRVEKFDDLEPNHYWEVVEGHRPRPIRLE